jgi:hypothetical protein
MGDGSVAMILEADIAVQLGGVAARPRTAENHREVGPVPGQRAMPEETAPQLQAEAPLLAEMLDELEHNLRSAVRTLEQLRSGLGGSAPPTLQVIQQQPEAPAEPEHILLGNNGGGAHAPFERLWERLEQERLEKQQPPEEVEVRGLDLLPRQYLMSVEDRERAVDLIPLHRALQKLTGVQEVSLVSFANGVPVVALRTDRELDLDQMRSSVETAMDRQCEVIPQDNGRVYLRLKPAADRGE